MKISRGRIVKLDRGRIMKRNVGYCSDLVK